MLVYQRVYYICWDHRPNCWTSAIVDFIWRNSVLLMRSSNLNDDINHNIRFNIQNYLRSWAGNPPHPQNDLFLSVADIRMTLWYNTSFCSEGNWCCIPIFQWYTVRFRWAPFVVSGGAEKDCQWDWRGPEMSMAKFQWPNDPNGQAKIDIGTKMNTWVQIEDLPDHG